MLRQLFVSNPMESSGLYIGQYGFSLVLPWCCKVQFRPINQQQQQRGHFFDHLLFLQRHCIDRSRMYGKKSERRASSHYGSQLVDVEEFYMVNSMSRTPLSMSNQTSRIFAMHKFRGHCHLNTLIGSQQLKIEQQRPQLPRKLAGHSLVLAPKTTSH